MASDSTISRSYLSIEADSLRDIVDRYVTPFVTLAFIASLFTTGLISFEFLNLSVTSWDFAILLLAANAAALLVLHDRSRLRIPKTAVILGVAFGIWVIVGAFRSPQEFRGFTMAALLLRNYVMVFSLLTIFTFALSLNFFSKSLFVVGSLMALLALALYFPNADIVSSRRPFGSIIVLIGEYQVPRLTGFTRDPNFFVLTALISLFFVFAFRSSLRYVWIWSGVLLLLLSVIFTFSRSGYVSLAVGLAAILIVAVVYSRRLESRKLLTYSVAISALFIITFVGVSRLELNRGRSTWELTKIRFGQIENAQRFDLWTRLIEGSDADPVSTPVPPTAVPDPVSTPVPPTEVPDPVSTPVPPTAVPDPVSTPVPATAVPDPVSTPVPPTAVPDPISTPVPPTAVPDPASTPVQPTAVPDDGRSTSGDSAWTTVVGNGLRSNEVRLGAYSHNSYLDVSEEMGIVGATLWGTIAVLVGFTLFRSAMRNPVAIPWIAAYAVVLVMMSTLSMLFMPYFWLVAAIAIHLSTVSADDATSLAETPASAPAS